MGKLILVQIIVYFMRAVMRVALELRSRNWPNVEATLARASVSSGLSHSVVFHYTYEVAKARYSGTDKWPYCFKESAQQDAEQLLRAGKIRIRYNPSDPNESIVRK